ncbi:MAG: hypothetical protein Q9187_002688 [Circinaria calcarea]
MSPSTIHDARRIYKIASIPGDGIGPEVISAGMQVLHKLGAATRVFELHVDHIEWGSDYYKKHGRYIPDDGLESLKKFDAIFFGSVGAPGISPSLLELGPEYAEVRLIFQFQTYRTISRSGVSGWQFASPCNNTQMSARSRYCAALPLRYGIANPATSTG